jgi:hypothetical protein
MRVNSLPFLLCIAACPALLIACASDPVQHKTSLELQAFQAREFETEKSIAFAATMTVFQDLGYIVASADKETGFITASSPQSSSKKFFSSNITTGQTKATAFIEQIRPGYTSIRLNFLNTKHVSGKKGQTLDEDTPILDPPAYQIAFGKIEDAIFIRSGSKPTVPRNNLP